MITVILYSLILSVVVTALALGLLTLSYRKLLDRLYKAGKEENEERVRAVHEAEDILFKAREKAQEILLEAQKSAVSKRENILDEYKKLTDSLKDSFEQAIKSDSEELVSLHSKQISEMQNRVSEQLSLLSQKALQDVEIYKKSQIDRIEKSVEKIVSEVALDVFGKSLSMKEHEEIILKSLEEAYKRHAA